jgi:hypothetical protein
MFVLFEEKNLLIYHFIYFININQISLIYII